MAKAELKKKAKALGLEVETEEGKEKTVAELKSEMSDLKDIEVIESNKEPKEKYDLGRVSSDNFVAAITKYRNGGVDAKEELEFLLDLVVK